MKVRVWVGTSRIAGKELFAAHHITKGTRIIQYIGQRISKAQTAERLYQGNQYIFTFNDRYDIDGKTLKNKARYINHSCDPNCEILITPRTIWIVAKRDIQEGEELSDNYETISLSVWRKQLLWVYSRGGVLEFIRRTALGTGSLL